MLQQKRGAAVKFSTAKETMKPEQVINQDPEIHGGVPSVYRHPCAYTVAD